MTTANPLLSFIPLFLMMVPIAFLCAGMAKRLNKNELLWFFLGIIPFINYFLALWLIFLLMFDFSNKLNDIIGLLKEQNRYLPRNKRSET